MSGFQVRETTRQDETLSNVEAERRLIGVMLSDSRTADWFAEKTCGEDFSDRLLGRMFDLILSEASAGRTINDVILAPFFRDDETFADAGGVAMLRKIMEGATLELTPEAYADQIRALAVQRRLVAGLRQAMLAATVVGADLTAVISEADAILTGAIERSDAARFYDGSDSARWVVDNMNTAVVGVSTNRSHSIEHLIGHIRAGDLIILAGRPGMGKTAAVISYMRTTALAGHASLFASLEMSFETLSERLVADQCHARGDPIRFKALKDRKLTPDEQRSVCRAAADLRDMPFKIIDKRCHTLAQLRRAIRRRKRELAVAGKKLELVIVDYLQLMGVGGKPKSEYETVSEVSRELKIMAGDEDVAMVVLSQLSREVEKRTEKRPQLSDLRSSGQIEADADAVIFLLSQEYYMRKDEPAPEAPEHFDWAARIAPHRDVLEFICAKNRNGPEGTHFGRFFTTNQAVR
jgi:replicative DNA helicase